MQLVNDTKFVPTRSKAIKKSKEGKEMKSKKYKSKQKEMGCDKASSARATKQIVSWKVCTKTKKMWKMEENIVSQWEVLEK